jgi:hypothetical protein
VASAAVPFLFITSPACQRHITTNATEELKHDGYRAIAFKSDGKLYLRSRNNKDFADRYPKLLKGLEELPDETVIDGEVVAFDEFGRPSFNVLQNSATGNLVYYIYDVMVLAGKDVMAEPLDKRRGLLEKKVLPTLTEPVRYSQHLDVRLEDLSSLSKPQVLKAWSRRRVRVDTSPVSARALGKRCGSKRDKNSSSAATLSEAQHSMPWSLGTTRETSCCTQRAHGTASRLRRGRHCPRNFARSRLRSVRSPICRRKRRAAGGRVSLPKR